MLEKRVKKANITLFIIVGILILVVFVMLFALIGRLAFHGNSQFKEVTVFIDGCYEQSTNNALVYVSKQGGIYLINNLDEKELLKYDEAKLNEFSSTHMNDIKGMNLDKEPIFKDAIEREKFEDELSKATGFLFKQCLNNFTNFQAFNTNQNVTEMKITTKIEKTGVTIALDYPVTFTLGGGSKLSKMTLERKESYFAVHLYDMIELGNELITKRNTNINIEQTNKDFSYLDTDIYPFDDYYLYVIKDSAKVNGKSFKFAFVTKNKRI